MSILEASPSRWTGRMLSILRLVSGFLFIAHGTMKLFDYPPMPPGSPPIELMSQMGLAGTGESRRFYFCFIYLYLVFAGGGPWSVDSMIARRRKRSP